MAGDGGRGDRPYFIVLVVLIGGLYAGLLNPYWARGGDSEVYLSLARSIVLGEGYVFNGQPAVLIPPVWPLMLAGVMAITPSMLALKVLTMICLWAWLAITYWILRYWTGPMLSAVCTLATALLVPVVPLSYLQFSDPVFLAFTAASILFALQIAHGRSRFGWRLAGLLVFAFLAAMTRTAALTTLPLLFAILLAGSFWPGMHRKTLAAFLCGVVVLGGIIGWQWSMHVTPDQIDPRYDTMLTGQYNFFNPPETQTFIEMVDVYALRVSRLGRFSMSLFLDPIARSGSTQNVLNIVGWFGLIVFGVFAIEQARRRQWLWLMVIAFIAAISLNWPNPPTRYLLPIAPLLLLGTIFGTAQLLRRVPSLPARYGLLGLSCAGAAMIALYNVALYTVELRTARSSNFPIDYQGGMYASLPAVADWINEHASHSKDIAITQASPNRRLFTHGHMRAFHFLTNRPIVLLPAKHSRELTATVGKYCSRRNIGIYLFQPAYKPYSALRDLVNRPPEPVPPWEVHIIRDGRARRLMDLPLEKTAITEVPGLETVSETAKKD